MEKSSTWLTLPSGEVIEVPYHHSNGLPMLFECSKPSILLTWDDIDSEAVHLNMAHEANQNFTRDKKEYLLNHQKACHANGSWVQELMRGRKYDDGKGNILQLPPVFPTKHKKTKSCDRPRCAGCLLGKMGRRSTCSSLTQNLGEMTLRAGSITPGSLIFCDQYSSSELGRRWETFGREHDRDKFIGGTLYYDSSSTVMHCNHQVSLQAGDTIAGKHKVEEFYQSIGSPIQSFRGDNQIFNSAEFLDDCARSHQTVNFCGVGAHHQNGVAERAIQTVTKWARTIMIDAAINWPDQADLSLWPMAMDHAVWMWNHLPKEGVGLSPLELATGIKSSHEELKRLHVWGCPGFLVAMILGSPSLLPPFLFLLFQEMGKNFK